MRKPVSYEKEHPQEIYLIPLFEAPFFPAQQEKITINSTYWHETIKLISKLKVPVAGFVLFKEHEGELSTNMCYKVGTLFKLSGCSYHKNSIEFTAEGICRFKIKKWLTQSPPFKVEVTYPHDKKITSQSLLRAYTSTLVAQINSILPKDSAQNREFYKFIKRYAINNPTEFVDFAVNLINLKSDKLQKVLECLDFEKRIKLVLKYFKNEARIQKLEHQITKKIEADTAKRQRDFFLKEQLKVIQQELGLAQDPKQQEQALLEKKIAALNVTDEIRQKILDEFNNFKILDPTSSEYAVSYNYLTTVTSIPWGIYTQDQTSLTRAKRILNKEHEYLNDVKERILEFLALRIMRQDITGSMLLLVGAPGVGKTSIAKSIATVLGRKLYHVALSGFYDEAELKGHRRTYVGAMPGKIIQALIHCKSQNPVIILDELDKISAPQRHTHPSANLLEVLDPTQNTHFLDNYVNLPCDLSKVLFICTANQLDTIPDALLDRMEIINLPGYILEEKLQIAQKHLIPKLLQQSGMKKSQFKLSTPALRHIIDGYAREAGVRHLEQILARIMRKSALMLLQHKKEKAVVINIKDIPTFLDQPYFNHDQILLDVGVMIGLAWTTLGGVTMKIEAIAIRSNSPGIKLTGCIGKVMEESAEIAYSYVQSHIEAFQLDDVNFFNNAQIHIHIPEGATPKDGPSAGITIAAALLSLAKNYKLKEPIAMTGELTLTGHVLAVGGIREKVIAAKRNNIDTIILPASVQEDYKSIAAHVRKGLKVHFVSHFSEVFDIIF